MKGPLRGRDPPANSTMKTQDPIEGCLVLLAFLFILGCGVAIAALPLLALLALLF